MITTLAVTISLSCIIAPALKILYKRIEAKTLLVENLSILKSNVDLKGTHIASVNKSYAVFQSTISTWFPKYKKYLRTAEHHLRNYQSYFVNRSHSQFSSWEIQNIQKYGGLFTDLVNYILDDINGGNFYAAPEML